MNILEEIFGRTKKDLDWKKERQPVEQLRRMAEARVAELAPDRFRNAISNGGLQIIAEVKKASPSKGHIVDQFDYLRIAREYDEGGAAAISVLTEPHYFRGELSYLAEIASAIKRPVLRKDFICDEYQIFEAAANGAAAVLLIATFLEEQEIVKLGQLADSFKLNALVEVHDLPDLEKALGAGARIIGINNRDLKTFQVNMDTSLKLAEHIPRGIIKVSESGIESREEIETLGRAGFQAALIGETLMRRPDRAEYLRYLRGEPCG